jgi:hypothetical protein
MAAAWFWDWQGINSTFTKGYEDVVAMNARKNSSITVYNIANENQSSKAFTDINDVFVGKTYYSKSKNKKTKKQTIYKIFGKGSFMKGYKVSNK